MLTDFPCRSEVVLGEVLAVILHCCSTIVPCRARATAKADSIVAGTVRWKLPTLTARILQSTVSAGTSTPDVDVYGAGGPTMQIFG